MIINIEQALNLIDTTIYIEGSSKPQYFFIVGAGISMPEIPSAKGIVDRCKSEVKKRNEEYYNICVEKIDKFSNEPMKYYSAWISEAFPNRVNRSDFFKELNAKAKISSANLILAQILNSRKLAQTVFTTNFDDKIKSALNLIGANEVFVAENVMDNLVVNPDSDAIQIIHVHGTYNFYDCANIESEINHVANQSDVLSSSRVLSRFLHSQAPIIVGYSGWENDVIMTCLKERLSYATPLNYIWICYSREDYDCLPSWLKDSKSVSFVVAEHAEDCEEYLDYKIDSSSLKHKIDATAFFSTLMNRLNIRPPELFINPFKYYSKMINNVLPEHEDVLHLRHWAQRLQYLGSGNEIFENFISEFENAFLMKDFTKAADLLEEISNENLSVGDIQFVCSTLIHDLINVENESISFGVRLACHFSALSFIEKNYQCLLSSKGLEDSLSALLFMNIKRDNQEDYLKIVEKIYELAQRDSSTLSVMLSSLGVKSSIVKDKNEKLSLLVNLVENCPKKSTRNDILFLKTQALLDIARLQENEQAVNALREAEAIVSKFDIESLKQRIVTVKSEILYKITNLQLVNELVYEILESICDSNTELIQQDELEIASNITDLNMDELQDVEKIYKTLVKVIKKYAGKEFSYCCDALHYIKICLAVCDKTDDSLTKLDYCEKSYYLIDKHLGKCSKSESLLYNVTYCYCELPISIVPDDLKIKKLKEFQDDNSPFSYQSWFSLLWQAAMIGDVSKYEAAGFTKEIMLIKNQRKCHEGVNLYLAKKYLEAEQIFVEVSNCGVTDVENSAKTNLCFMIRRNEATIKREKFLETICTIPENSSIKLMNIILYYIEEGDTADELYISALNELKNLTEREILDAVSWWSNIEVVGEEESRIAMNVLTTYTKEI